MAKADEKPGTVQETEQGTATRSGITAYTPAPPEPATKYPIQELLDHSVALFSYGPEVLVGALHGRDDKELTVDEAKAFITEFLKKKVN